MDLSMSSTPMGIWLVASFHVVASTPPGAWPWHLLTLARSAMTCWSGTSAMVTLMSSIPILALPLAHFKIAEASQYRSMACGPCSSVMELPRAQPTNFSSPPVLMLKHTVSSATFSLKVKLGLASNLPGYFSKRDPLRYRRGSRYDPLWPELHVFSIRSGNAHKGFLRGKWEPFHKEVPYIMAATINRSAIMI